MRKREKAKNEKRIKRKIGEGRMSGRIPHPFTSTHPATTTTQMHTIKYT